MKRIGLLFALVFSCCQLATAAEADSSTAATHDELRKLRDGLLDAMNKGDIERELTYLDTNVVVTWPNAEVSRGREGVRSYYTRLTSGPQKMVDNFSAEIHVDELAILNGENTGISFGSSLEHLKLTNGRSFDLKGRWTATLVREDGRWLIASLHVSTNLFDNAILEMIKKRAFAAVCLFFVVGGLSGWLIGRLRRRPAS